MENMNNLTKRVSTSPLIHFANFEDGSHVNLIRILKPYSDGRSYFVHETTKSIFCSSGYFLNYDQALTKFNLMVSNGSVISNITTSGKLTHNF